MDWSKIAEEKIVEAMGGGDLEPKTGKGKPLNMDAYFAPREEDRVAYHVLRTSGHVPEEVGLLSEIAQLREALARPCDAERRKALGARLAQVEVDYNMRLERRMGRGAR